MTMVSKVRGLCDSFVTYGTSKRHAIREEKCDWRRVVHLRGNLWGFYWKGILTATTKPPRTIYASEGSVTYMELGEFVSV